MMVYKDRKSIKLWLWSGVILVAMMVLIGGITRLTGSGLSMVEWKVIGGTIPPLTEEEWQETFTKYQQFPEYQKVNSSMSIESFKKIFWWEYFHRLLGRLIGLIFIIPFLFFLIRKSLSTPLIKKLVLIMVLGGFQGIMGWIMVKSGLVDLPHVSHYKLAMHLGLAFLLIAMILWTIFDLDKSSLKGYKALGNLKMGYTLMFFFALQVVLGAFTAGLKAGFSYNTFPLMEGRFFPSTVYSGLRDLAESGPIVQFLHRWCAFVVLGLVLYLFYRTKRYIVDKTVQKTSTILLVIVIFQVLLGIVTLVHRVPLFLGVLHQLMALVFWGFLVKIIHTYNCYKKGKGWS